MKSHGIKLDDYTFMSDPDNANKVLETLSPHEGDPPSMPPGGPYWTADQLALFAQWQKEGIPAVIQARLSHFGSELDLQREPAVGFEPTTC